MNLLQRLNPEALAKIDQEALEFPGTVAILKNQLLEVDHVLDLKFETVLLLTYSLQIELNYTTINELFI